MFTRKRPDKPKQQERDLFAFRPIQKVLVGIVTALLISLVVIRLAELQRPQENMLQLSESAAGEYELNVVQRESVVYVAEYGQWLSGLSTRREVQIRRALLGQRLIVQDTSGVPAGERVSSKYLQTLAELDLIVFMAKPGYLSTNDGVAIRKKSKAALDTFVSEFREFDLEILLARNTHQRTIVDAETRRRANVFNILLTVNLLIIVLAAVLAISRSRDYRQARHLVLREREQLVATQYLLDRSRKEAQVQTENDEIRRREIFRLDSIAMPILSNIRGSANKQQIVDTLIAGVGTSIGADMVIFHSFPTPDEQRVLGEWRSTSDEKVYEAEFLRNEEALEAVIGDIWERLGVVTISDTNLFDPALIGSPSLADAIMKSARSWIVVPLGEGSRVLGYIAGMMLDETRDWSSDEIPFVRTLVANAANSIVRLRYLEQTAQIAEHEAVVNRLVENDKARKNFIATVNHELRTPLTSIIGYLELIQERGGTDLDPDIANSFNIVMRNARRLQTLVENTLFISLLDRRQSVFDATPVDVGQLLHAIVDALLPMAQKAEVEVNLVVEGKKERLCIEGNGSQIEQLFTNLVSNAVKFTPKHGAVTVTARHVDLDNGSVVETTVRDTGIGIPAEEADGLFGRFTRGSNALDAMIPGTGLGLSIVKEVVEIHGGSVTFTSKIGEGTEFTVKLPVVHVV